VSAPRPSTRNRPSGSVVEGDGQRRGTPLAFAWLDLSARRNYTLKSRPSGGPAAAMPGSDGRDPSAARPRAPSRAINPPRPGPLRGAGGCDKRGLGRAAGPMDGGDGSGRDCRHWRSRHGYRDGLGAGRCLGGRSAERHVSQKAWTGRNVNDDQFKQIAEFAFPYSKFERGDATWVTLEVKPTNVPFFQDALFSGRSLSNFLVLRIAAASRISFSSCARRIFADFPYSRILAITSSISLVFAFTSAGELLASSPAIRSSLSRSSSCFREK
jgi:hypothetical protein